jgi:hypothetical protein
MIKKGTKTSTTTDINDKRNVESKEITLENRTPFYKRIQRLAAKSEEQSLSLSSQPSLGSHMGKILGVLNGFYWSMNLFGFLIPIASLRYLRAHYFCVEVSEVVVREGGDHNIGLLS